MRPTCEVNGLLSGYTGEGAKTVLPAKAMAKVSCRLVPDQTPEEIEDWLRWYHSLEPLEFTPEEEADLAAWRRKVKEYEIARSAERMEGLFQSWATP